LPTKSYPLWVDAQLKIPELWSKNGMTIKKTISWDQETTNILSARLDIDMNPDIGYVKAWVEHNVVEIQRWWWVIGDESAKQDSADITGTLYNGSNTFKFVGAKEFANPAKVVFIVTASVIIEYEGEEPEIGEDWIKLIQEVASGVAIGGGAYIVSSSLRVGSVK